MHRPTISESAFPNPLFFSESPGEALQRGRALRRTNRRGRPGKPIVASADQEPRRVTRSAAYPGDALTPFRDERGLVSRTYAGNRALLPLSGRADRLRYSAEDAAPTLESCKERCGPRSMTSAMRSRAVSGCTDFALLSLRRQLFRGPGVERTPP